MKKEHFLTFVFLLITSVLFYLFYRIIIPFFAPICWAAVLVIIFHPIYERLKARIKSGRLSSVLMCLLILLLIIGPITYLFIALVNEAASAVAKVNVMYRAGEFDSLLSFDLPWLTAVKEKLSQYYDLSQVNINELIKDSIDRISGIILNQTSWLIANGTKTIFYFVLMVFSMYYFFKDGRVVINKLKRLVPLTPEQVDVTFKQLSDVIHATMYGGVIVALIQGFLGGVFFAILGIQSAIFWGAIMALLSIIPFLGAFIVYIPAGIILIIGGSYIKGIVLIAAGTLIISQIDNLIRPYLISGRTSLHPLLLFFSIMGGIAMFGLLGIVLGPLIMAAFVTILQILEIRLHPDEEIDADPEREGEEQPQ
ncbi:MAG: AI-2E family transporter [candidate division Zixibacteria bacterium]|nr:AI-2E family transporter [candidate division Zixibacteria bacterium]